MQETDQSHKAVIFAAIVFVLFGTYVSYAIFLSGQPTNLPLVRDIAAKDGEDDSEGSEGGSDSEEDDSKSENNNDDEDEKSEEEVSETSEEKAAAEALKKKREAAREAAKKTNEQLSEVSESSGQGGSSDDDQLNEMSEVSETEKSEEGSMYTDREKTLARLNKKIAEAEKEILEKQSEGVNVTAALAALALAKEKAKAVDDLFSANQIEQVKALTKEAEQLVKAARGKILHIAKEATQDMAKVEKRISQTEQKIALLESAGGDSSTYVSRLNELTSEWAALKAKIALGGDDALQALVLVETMERRVKSLKSAVEGALLALGATDDDFEVEHMSEVGEASTELVDLANLNEDEEEDGYTGIERLATAHQEDAVQVTQLVKKYESRSVGMRQLFGDDRKSLAALQGVVMENDARIQALESVIALVDDTEVTAMMNEKLAVLKEQNAELKRYVASRPVTNGVFGWLFNWF